MSGITAMGPVRLGYDVLNYFWCLYKEKEGQESERFKKMLWAIERIAFSIFIGIRMKRQHDYIASYRLTNIPQSLQDFLNHDFMAISYGMAWGFPETRVGMGGFLIKLGFEQIQNVVVLRRQNQPFASDNFLYGFMHITFGLACWIIYNCENSPYVNTLIYDSVQIFKNEYNRCIHQIERVKNGALNILSKIY